MSYDYIEGKKRIEEILNNSIKIVDSEKIPKNGSEFTFNNGYYNWVTAIFVDIRDSSELFSKKGLETKEETAKLIRAFTSEIIEILRDDDNLREIGIRGDCVYAIYTTSKKSDIFSCANKTFYINTYLNMLNKLLSSRGKETFKAGIGMATDQELVVKAGAAYTGINSKVWIGNAVTRASNLSALGEKETSDRLFFSELSYINFIEELRKRNSEKDVEEWFKKIKGRDGETSYHADIIKVEFDEWIKAGMAD
ncbi:hypothetical protein TEHN7126_1357 [Tetragenococcus halophilus subsp. halophilus]|uniref:adenylate/guanylate cyclase domain-containing protein n=1 Tax=Tetragenococcus halophilus TaxID=51669 RepID=UPI000CC7BD7B|nr:adenylate/guanylate cyclase domain-containing protein [Tetragenococcus halophilus]GBD72198.1 hypothetical protein TEHN7125_0358 [Tetragenococcus halophilus subsp. halophilus]GBD75658.1 hypothetical protein TEHN7126_1357 [Tetragenococcus halophilus subsp. halophilus]